MVDITHKSNSLRMAIAEARVKVSKIETIQAIQRDEVPKGNVFEIARAAGLLAAKKTSELIPDCHPLPIEYADIQYQIEGLELLIKVEIRTVYKTGVEVEAMHSASVVSLTLYDMLKPIDPEVEISKIRLLEKRGGKKDHQSTSIPKLKAAILLATSNEEGKSMAFFIKEKLAKEKVEILSHEVLENPQDWSSWLHRWAKEELDCLFLVSSSQKEASEQMFQNLEQHLDKKIPELEDLIRSYSQVRNVQSIFSPSLAGTLAHRLVLLIPGHPEHGKYAFNAIFPAIFPLLKQLRSQRS